MLGDIRITEFQPAYQRSAAELVNTGLGDHFGYVDESMNPDLFDIASRYRKGDFLLALDGEFLVGTGSLMPVNTEVGQIARMHTALEYRRRGIATRLLRALEQRATARGFRSVTLETNVDWLDAIAFYSRNQYVELGRNEFGIHFQKSLLTNNR